MPACAAEPSPGAVQCQSLLSGEPGSPPAAAWTCGLGSGSISGLVSAFPSAGEPPSPLEEPATFALNFYLPVGGAAAGAPTA